MAQPSRTIREGIIAGVLGASAVAVWFLIVDTVAGHPFFTPAVLGNAVLSVFGPPNVRDTMANYVVFYTLIHYAAFILVGILLALVVNRAEREPSVLIVLLLLFAAFELAFYGFTAVLAETRLRQLAWYQIAIGNLLATILMVAYMWRRHPALGQEFTHALGGGE